MMLSLPLTSLPLPPSLRNALQHAQLYTIQDIQHSPSQLADECGIPVREALQIIQMVKELRMTPRKEANQPAVLNNLGGNPRSSSPSAGNDTSNPNGLHITTSAVNYNTSKFTPLSATTLPPNYKALLQDDNDCVNVRTNNIAAGITPFNSSTSSIPSHVSALSTVPITSSVSGQSALLLYQQQRNRQAIFTGIQALDRVLGDGIRLGELIEFCGVPGIGKTQLCMQLSVNVQIPMKFGGCEGEAILIDSEGSFSASRCASIAEGLIEHIQRIQGSKGHSNSKNANSPPMTMSVESILRRIHVFRVFDHTEQLALFGSLETFLTSHPNIRLIVVDSIAFHFRRGFGSDFSARSRTLLNMASSLSVLANKFKLAIVLSNHVTTKIERKMTAKTSNQENNLYPGESANHMMQETSHLSPALGESWAHACATRVLLYWNNRVRAAKLIKSSSKLTASCSYLVAEKGVRDIPSSTSSSTSSPMRDGTNKRTREPSTDISNFHTSIDMAAKRSHPFKV